MCCLFSFKGVDENIYHWKVLNLSRAKLKASSRDAIHQCLRIILNLDS
jgi:hypothetical protein